MKKNRYLIKLSGEVLKGSLQSGIETTVVNEIAAKIAAIIKKTGIQVGLVIGGGNIFRGLSGQGQGYDRLFGDQMGMLATVINGLALVERLRYHGIDTIIQSGVKIDGVADLFNRDSVENHFKKQGCVVFSGGIGNPYFSTDTTAALRALQINAQYLIKATKVNGIYDKDPHKHEGARLYDKLTYTQIIDQRLQVMDLTAVQLLYKSDIQLMVLNMMDENNLENACLGKAVGTIVSRS